MIREIIVDFRDGDEEYRKEILSAIQVAIYKIAFENADVNLEHELPRFPGHVVINVFDENEQLIEIIET